MVPLFLSLVSYAVAEDVVAAAWDSLRVEDVGRLYDANLEPVAGVLAGDIRTVELGRTTRDRRTIQNVRELTANAKAWGIGQAEGSVGGQTTYGFFRAMEQARLGAPPRLASSGRHAHGSNLEGCARWVRLAIKSPWNMLSVASSLR